VRRAVLLVGVGEQVVVYDVCSLFGTAANFTTPSGAVGGPDRVSLPTHRQVVTLPWLTQCPSSLTIQCPQCPLTAWHCVHCR
jgi:hypothetical protein